MDENLRLHLRTPPGEPVYATRLSDHHEDAIDVDLEEVGWQIGEFREQLAQCQTKWVEEEVQELIACHGMPERDRTCLGLGLLQAHVQALEKSQERILKPVEPIVLEEPTAPSATPLTSPFAMSALPPPPRRTNALPGPAAVPGGDGAG